MKRFTDAGRLALEHENWYSALTLALTLPDICASLEDPGPHKTRSRYVRWSRTWIEPHFTSDYGGSLGAVVLITAEDLFRLRCSLIHSGSSEIESMTTNLPHKFEFFDDSNRSHLNKMQSNSFDGVPQDDFIQLNTRMFSNTIYDAADAWDVGVEQDSAIQAEKSKLLAIRSKGWSKGPMFQF